MKQDQGMDISRLNGITRLARAGALEQALILFRAQGLDARLDDPEVLTVHGRLLKDRAARVRGEAREALLSEAIAAYERASHMARATYPLINAATLALLAGRRERSRQLAVETLELIDGGDCAPETPYWLDATRAEALLLLERREEADAILAQAIRGQAEAWEDHASTLRQFAMISNEMGWDAAWLDHYRPPPSLHFEGIMGIAGDDEKARGAIAASLQDIGPANVVGALAAGADILVAEEALRLGGHLHAVLPCPAELFIESSVVPYGAAWEARFQRLMEEAASVLILDDWQPLSQASVSIARQAAMGLAIREARRLQSSAIAIRVEAVGEDGQCEGEADWSLHGREVRHVAVERSNISRATLPATARATALLTLPLELAVALPGESMRLAEHDGYVVYGNVSLTDTARLAQVLASRHPDARLGLDYRAVSGAQVAGRFERCLALASSDVGGALALSEPAALALSLQIPSANVEPMGSIRSAVGDLPVYGLFPDPVSGDELGEQPG